METDKKIIELIEFLGSDLFDLFENIYYDNLTYYNLTTGDKHSLYTYFLTTLPQFWIEYAFPKGMLEDSDLWEGKAYEWALKIVTDAEKSNHLQNLENCKSVANTTGVIVKSAAISTINRENGLTKSY